MFREKESENENRRKCLDFFEPLSQNFFCVKMSTFRTQVVAFRIKLLMHQEEESKNLTILI